jgi:hypothetical protein
MHAVAACAKQGPASLLIFCDVSKRKRHAFKNGLFFVHTSAVLTSRDKRASIITPLTVQPALEQRCMQVLSCTALPSHSKR